MKVHLLGESTIGSFNYVRTLQGTPSQVFVFCITHGMVRQTYYSNPKPRTVYSVNEKRQLDVLGMEGLLFGDCFAGIVKCA